MSEYVLKTENLGISFGGLKAVDGVNLEIKKNQIYGLIGPNGAGKTTVFNMLTGVYRPTTGTFYLNGKELKGYSQDVINQKGIARTFQNIRLFNNMTVIRNVMVVLGGMGNITGGIVSATVITVLNEKLTTILTGDLAVFKNIIYALILVLIVIYNNAPADRKSVV